ncbi:glycine-rich domain-containing protein [Streptomyces sp. NPDC051684]|uniref:glycine-rich domain-containing protein n=1 Tax=Streptomyces sp. NPDC051684 TaxID=3365670 RepID=UPI00378D5D9F
MSTAVKGRDPKTFVPQDVWERQVKLIMRDPDINLDKAERIFGQTVAYFVAAGENPDTLMGPSVEVDKGVHSFMLDTIPYHQFTYGHFGRYIHHVPELETDLCVQCNTGGEGDKKRAGDVACATDDDKAEADADGRPMVLEATVAAIEAAGFVIDRELWNMGAKCTQCHAGCTDSPNTGKGK